MKNFYGTMYVSEPVTWIVDLEQGVAHHEFKPGIPYQIRPCNRSEDIYYIRYRTAGTRGAFWITSDSIRMLWESHRSVMQIEKSDKKTRKSAKSSS